jgi:hypothetical protein
MPHDPRHKLTPEEIKTFRADSYRHPISGEPVEMGSGALPPDVQAAVVHVAEIERREGPEVANEVRRKLHMAMRPLAKKE